MCAAQLFRASPPGPLIQPGIGPIPFKTSTVNGGPVDLPHFVPPPREAKKKKTSFGCGYFTMKVMVALWDGTPLDVVAVSNMVYVPFLSKLQVSVETTELPAPKVG
jgi:hypothetical protein